MDLFNKRLFLVRHGETELNKAHIIQGQIDSPLTDLGIKQAHEAGEKAKELNIDILISSDLGRAKHTAEIISKASGIQLMRADPVLRERDFGKIEGMSTTELRKTYPQFVTDKDILILEHDFPTAEQINDFYNRIINGIKALMDEFDGKKVLLVGHKGVLNMVYAYANDVPLDKIRIIYDAQNCEIENY